MKKLLFGLGFACILFSSCQKTNSQSEHQNECLPLSVETIAGKYKISSCEYYDADSVQVENFETINPCEKDNIWELKTDGTLLEREGENKCSLLTETSGIRLTGIWQLWQYKEGQFFVGISTNDGVKTSNANERWAHYEDWGPILCVNSSTIICYGKKSRNGKPVTGKMILKRL